jgi:hypothetical protein
MSIEGARTLHRMRERPGTRLCQNYCGLTRVVAVSAQKSSKIEMKTTTGGFKIAFKHPTQRMPLLIICHDLLDPELAVLPRLVRSGSLGIDVGASNGTWTLLGGQDGSAGPWVRARPRKYFYAGRECQDAV